ncbi:MAG: hypothetical protein AAFX52_04130 [Pseudomonadota bacterium]
MNTMLHAAENEIIPDEKGAETQARDPEPFFNMSNEEFGWNHLLFVRVADIIVRSSDEKNAEAVARLAADGRRDQVVADLRHTEEALFALWQLMQMVRKKVDDYPGGCDQEIAT